ncbi:MAG: bifunctional pyr operon transcriptional regulator/uracil phosphoribosyltransferase PyrR [Gaiellales bacterium]
MAERELLAADQIQRTVRRIAHEIVEKHDDLASLALIGIHTRGVTLADRLHDLIYEFTGTSVPTGTLDVTHYRDDVTAGARPARNPAHPRTTRIDFPISGKSVVLVDDVLSTGRTIRAAIEALFDHGRPRRVQLAVLIDRGHRELPIRPDYVGKNMPTSRQQRVNVHLTEVDGADRVVLLSAE